MPDAQNDPTVFLMGIIPTHPIGVSCFSYHASGMYPRGALTDSFIVMIAPNITGPVEPFYTHVYVLRIYLVTVKENISVTYSIIILRCMC